VDSGEAWRRWRSAILFRNLEERNVFPREGKGDGRRIYGAGQGVSPELGEFYMKEGTTSPSCDTAKPLTVAREKTQDVQRLSGGEAASGFCEGNSQTRALKSTGLLKGKEVGAAGGAATQRRFYS